MPKSSVNASLSSYDDIFSTEESRQEEQREQVQQIPIGELFPFKNHPFKVLDDDSMSDTVESVKQYGVLSPLIARPRPKGGYEIISGHRRQHAAELAGLETLPVIVRQMDDDAAIILMVDSNLQREHILPSERAFAYKMKLDAMKNQGTRSDLTSTQVVSKLRSNEKLGAENNQSRETVRRFIRLTNLIPELLDMVDNKTVSFNPAVELSYLSPEQQQEVIRAMDDTQNFPSVSQAKRIKKLAQDGTFTTETVIAIMGEEKKSELDTVTIKNDTLRKYFPRSYTPKQMEDTIARYEQEIQELERSRKEILKKAKEEAERLLQESNAKIENTIRTIKEAQAEKERTRTARQELTDFKQQVENLEKAALEEKIARKMEKLREKQERKKDKKAKQANAPETPVAPKVRPIEAGDYVRIKGQTSVGQVMEISGKNAVVMFGLMKTNVKADRLERTDAPKATPLSSKATFVSSETQDRMYEKKLNFKQDIDVRGMRGDEAIQAVTYFFDDAILVGVSRVRILHGTGTGILRTLIRQYLATVPGVAHFQDEHVQFGGAGITVVDLK